jgi:hypothetical protein
MGGVLATVRCGEGLDVDSPRAALSPVLPPAAAVIGAGRATPAIGASGDDHVFSPR